METIYSILTCLSLKEGPRLKGFILVEFLAAILLFSLAGTGLYTGFMQGIRANHKIRELEKTHDGPRLFFLRLEKDLRNAVALKDYPFQGKKDEIKFPAKHSKLLLISYVLKEGSLTRREEELSARLVKEKPKERILLKGLKSFEFLFPYEDGEENRSFESFWLEEPYYGIPRSVKTTFATEDSSFEKLVSIPQGKIGRIQNE